MRFELVHKETFTNQLLAIPRNQIAQILEKISLLRLDPFPDGKLKKKLQGYKGNIYRLRAGDFRVFYTFGDSLVSLLGVKQRKDAYRSDLPSSEPLNFSSNDVELILDSTLESAPTKHYEPPIDVFSIKMDDPILPIKIDSILLMQLRIPEVYFEALASCSTIDDLCNVNVPGNIRDRVFDAVATPDFEQILQKPDLTTGDIDNLVRFVDGELLGFLLKLSPEQEKLAYWSLNGVGPTLLKGGPGTGKTTIALYRVKAVIEAHRFKGVRDVGADASPRILFTTYTNALVAYCEQQLRHLLGSDADCVSVRTADSIVREVVTRAKGEWRPADVSVERHALSKAFESVRILHQQTPSVSLDSIAQLSPDYLLEEFGGVIEAREIASLEDYLSTTRSGRVVGLRPNQRTLVWALYDEFRRELERLRLSTWRQLRRRAIEMIRSDDSIERYDAVIVDEAQDLDPTVLRLLAVFSKTPRRIFIAADANQSIYGSGFRWSDVHEDLQFRGRTATVTINHRSTREIGDAAHSYFQRGALETINAEHGYSRRGSKPVVHLATNVEEEADALAAYLRRAAQNNRVGLGSCAVLVPSHASGQAIVTRLRGRNIPAQFMASRELDLDQPVVKVLTLKTSKGLEFPVVAIAGYIENSTRSEIWLSEEREERLHSSRRTLFVAMTRAMRDLFIITPATHLLPELDGFDETLWEMSRSH